MISPDRNDRKVTNLWFVSPLGSILNVLKTGGDIAILVQKILDVVPAQEVINIKFERNPKPDLDPNLNVI